MFAPLLWLQLTSALRNHVRALALQRKTLDGGRTRLFIFFKKKREKIQSLDSAWYFSQSKNNETPAPRRARTQVLLV
jgi:hypothetical protein